MIKKSSSVILRFFKGVKQVFVSAYRSGSLKNIVKALFLLAALGSFFITIGVGLFAAGFEFINSKQITTTEANIGFAIQVALASVCFSWCRALDPKLEEQITMIRNGGHRFLLGAFFFLMGSATKYGIGNDYIKPESFIKPLLNNFVNAYVLLAINFFLFGFVMVFIVLISFLDNSMQESIFGKGRNLPE